MDTLPDRCVRFQEWLDDNALEIEMKIISGNYGRIWVGKLIELQKSWVFDNPVKGNKKLWRKFCFSWITRDWFDIPEEERERLRAQKPESQAPNYDGPPST